VPGLFVEADDDEGTTRRAVISKGMLGAVVVLGGALVAGLDAGIGRLAGRTTPSGRTTTLRRRPGSSTSSGATTPGGTTSGGATAGGGTAPPGHPIGASADVPVGGAAAFNDPATGDTSLVIQPRPGTFVAFDAICPHQGCTVQYLDLQKRFVCPCHQSEFDATTGAVLSGPSPTGLTPITLSVGPNGDLYAV
jgi:thiosulfate dehydrogenase [quinone] large subunit